MGLLKDFLKKQEALISVDVGANSVKLVELDLSTDRPILRNIGVQPLSADVFSGNLIAKSEKVAEQISALLEANAISDKRAITAVPGPSAFTKRIKTSKMEANELRGNIYFEAGNFIPHNIDAVKLDYHIIGEAGKNQLDVLVVAVKNEVVESYLASMSLAGLETAVVDIDYFALQNIFELSYPEYFNDTVALINVGSRYSSISICRSGESLFCGDISVGGKLLTDNIAEGLGVSASEAEQLKKSYKPGTGENEVLQDIIDRNVEYMATEFNRQLSFFWNAAGAEEGIDRILLSGGASVVPGLLGELGERTGLECGLLDPFKSIDCSEGFDAQYLKELSPCMAIGLGLALRQAGDRVPVPS